MDQISVYQNQHYGSFLWKEITRVTFNRRIKPASREVKTSALSFIQKHSVNTSINLLNQYKSWNSSCNKKLIALYVSCLKECTCRWNSEWLCKLPPSNKESTGFMFRQSICEFAFSNKNKNAYVQIILRKK